MYNYKIHNDENEYMKCVLVDSANIHESKNIVFTYDKENKEIKIQLSPTKVDRSNSIEWDVTSSEYLPFINTCTIYNKKKLLESIDNINGIHVSKCGNTLFLISSNIEIEL